MRLIILGAPGAGKGTQAKNISDRLNIPHISTGDIFRAHISNNTELGLKAKSYMDKGLLVPDELVVDIVVDRIKAEDCKEGFLFDGFPRTIPQAIALDKMLDARDSNIDFAINIDVDDATIINRMSGRRACPHCGATYHLAFFPPAKEGICDKCGSQLILRDDDAPETVKKRLTVYDEQTRPLIEYYQDKGILKSIDGTKDIQVITGEVMDMLGV
jgi:adenylate kinase